jgi:hypothetical protein
VGNCLNAGSEWITSNPEVISSPVGLVPRNALVLPEPISSDRPVETSRRRLVVRYGRRAENFLGMLQLACCLILLRHL